VSAWLRVAPSELEQPGRQPSDRVTHAWDVVRGELGDAAVGVRASQEWTLAALGLFGFSIATAPSVREALESAIRHAPLVSTSGSWRLRAGRGEARMTWTRSATAAPGREVSDEVMVAALVRCYRELSGEMPRLVEFAHQAPRGRASYEGLIGCEVLFGRDENAVVLDPEQLDIVPHGANPPLWRSLDDLAAREIRLLDSPSVADRARSLVTGYVLRTHRRPAIGEVARGMAMSERTLRRRLESEGAHFRTIVSEVCLERAAQLIALPDGTCTEAALESGFASAVTFGRAWKRARGVAPSKGAAG